MQQDDTDEAECVICCETRRVLFCKACRARVCWGCHVRCIAGKPSGQKLPISRCQACGQRDVERPTPYDMQQVLRQDEELFALTCDLVRPIVVHQRRMSLHFCTEALNEAWGAKEEEDDQDDEGAAARAGGTIATTVQTHLERLVSEVVTRQCSCGARADVSELDFNECMNLTCDNCQGYICAVCGQTETDSMRAHDHIMLMHGGRIHLSRNEFLRHQVERALLSLHALAHNLGIDCAILFGTAVVRDLLYRQLHALELVDDAHAPDLVIFRIIMKNGKPSLHCNVGVRALAIQGTLAHTLHYMVQDHLAARAMLGELSVRETDEDGWIALRHGAVVMLTRLVTHSRGFCSDEVTKLLRAVELVLNIIRDAALEREDEFALNYYVPDMLLKAIVARTAFMFKEWCTMPETSEPNGAHFAWATGVAALLAEHSAVVFNMLEERAAKQLVCRLINLAPISSFRQFHIFEFAFGEASTRAENADDLLKRINDARKAEAAMPGLKLRKMQLLTVSTWRAMGAPKLRTEHAAQLAADMQAQADQFGERLTESELAKLQDMARQTHADGEEGDEEDGVELTAAEQQAVETATILTTALSGNDSEQDARKIAGALGQSIATTLLAMPMLTGRSMRPTDGGALWREISARVTAAITSEIGAIRDHARGVEKRATPEDDDTEPGGRDTELRSPRARARQT